jgi:hypothetical protein
MIARAEWRFRQITPRLQTKTTGRLLRNSQLLVAGLTAVFLFWLVYRWIGHPAWLARLPQLLAELLRLAEWSWFITLGFLWGVIWWRRQQPEKPSVAVLTGDELYALSPADFERYVAALFRRKGYRVQLRGRSGDRGVDLMLHQRNGKRAIVQCKRYRNTIGPKIVRELYGTLIHERVAHAFLVTTADISESAREWSQGKPMTLIDGEALVQIAAVLGAEVAG